MKTLLVCAFLISTSFAYCQESSIAATPVVSSAPVTGVHVQQRLGSQVPLNATFKDRDGSSVSFGQILGGKPAIVLPIFYRCKGVCSSEFENLCDVIEKMPKRVGRDYSVVVVGIDPQENPRFAEQKFESEVAPIGALKGTDAGWHLLTGTLDQIRNVTDALGFFYSYDPQTDLINHPAGLMFVTGAGRVSGYELNPYAYSADDFARGLSNAATSKVGQPVPDLFFGCIHCDPITGRKSLNILRFLSIAGVVTVLGLVGMVFGLTRKVKGGKDERPA